MTPVYITKRNALEVLGVPWATVIRWASERGVALVRPSRRKTLVPLAELRAALERQPATTEPVTEGDAAEAVRRALGKKRAA